LLDDFRVSGLSLTDVFGLEMMTFVNIYAAFFFIKLLSKWVLIPTVLITSSTHLSNRMSACLPVSLPRACLPDASFLSYICLSACRPVGMFVCLPAVSSLLLYLSASLPVSVLVCLPSCQAVCLPAVSFLHINFSACLPLCLFVCLNAC